MRVLKLFFENNGSGIDLPYSQGFMKFGTLKKERFTFIISNRSEQLQKYAYA